MAKFLFSDLLYENELNLMNAQTFSKDILDLKKLDPDSSFLDIIVLYCEDRGINIDQVPNLIIPKLYYMIEEESTSLNLITKENYSKLPV